MRTHTVRHSLEPPRAMMKGCTVRRVTISCSIRMPASGEWEWEWGVVSALNRRRARSAREPRRSTVGDRALGIEIRDQRIGDVVAPLIAIAGRLREALHDDRA